MKLCVRYVFAIRRLLLFRNLSLRRLFLLGPTDTRTHTYFAPHQIHKNLHTRTPKRQSEKEMRNIENNLRRYLSTSLDYFLRILPLFWGRVQCLGQCRLQTIIHIRTLGSMAIHPLSFFSYIYRNRFIYLCSFFLFFSSSLSSFSSRSDASVIQIVM